MLKSQYFQSPDMMFIIEQFQIHKTDTFCTACFYFVIFSKYQAVSYLIVVVPVVRLMISVLLLLLFELLYFEFLLLLVFNQLEQRMLLQQSSKQKSLHETNIFQTEKKEKMSSIHCKAKFFIFPLSSKNTAPPPVLKYNMDIILHFFF